MVRRQGQKCFAVTHKQSGGKVRNLVHEHSYICMVHLIMYISLILPKGRKNNILHLICIFQGKSQYIHLQV